MIKILIVEDDPNIAKLMEATVAIGGYESELCDNGSAAFDKIEGGNYDLILLDVMLPDMSGFEIMRKRTNTDAPVIFITAKQELTDKVRGLRLGAEDYISKPFRPRELVSRIRSVLRRCGKTQAVLEIGELRVDTVRALVTKGGMECFLSALEYRLLLFFLNHKGQVLSRNQLLEEIWDAAGEFVNDNTLTVYIKRLREKIETDPQNPEIIRTVRGLGYKLGE